MNNRCLAGQSSHGLSLRPTPNRISVTSLENAVEDALFTPREKLEYHLAEYHFACTVVYCAEAVRRQQSSEATKIAMVVKSSSNQCREAVVIKISWDRLNMKIESRQRRGDLPKLLVPNVRTSDEHLKSSSPRHKLLSKNVHGYRDNIILVALMLRYHFTRIFGFRDIGNEAQAGEVFRFHNALWKWGSPHRDISINNTMCLEAADDYTGILLDFDLAVLSDGEGNCYEQSNKNKFREPTPVFMAMDPLRGIEGPHLYRFDLESLLYVIIWRSCSYVDDEGRIISGFKLCEWLTGSYCLLHANKHSLLTGDTLSWLPLMDEYRPILSWLYDLIDMFYDGLSARRKQIFPFGIINIKDPDHKTLYGHVTHENFSEIVEKNLGCK